MTPDAMTASTGLRCPKCDSPMRTYERNGVHVDRCIECGGLFLDRGELERLVDAEAGFYGDRGGPSRADERPDRRERWRDDDDWDDDDRRGGRRGFLEDLFDFG